MKEYDKIVAAAGEAIETRKREVERVVADLGEFQYRLRYIRWITDRKQRLQNINTSWARFSR